MTVSLPRVAEIPRAGWDEVSADESPTVEMDIDPFVLSPGLTLPQWEAWGLIRIWYPNAKLDESRGLVSIPQSDFELFVTKWTMGEWLDSFGLYDSVDFTETVFTPGFSINLDTPQLTGAC